MLKIGPFSAIRFGEKKSSSKQASNPQKPSIPADGEVVKKTSSGVMLVRGPQGKAKDAG